MAERNTTTEKEGAKKTRAARAKDDAPKTAAKRGRPRKPKAPVGELAPAAAAAAGGGAVIDETGVKLYAPKVVEDDTPFSFDAAESAVSVFAAAEPAGRPGAEDAPASLPLPDGTDAAAAPAEGAGDAPGFAGAGEAVPGEAGAGGGEPASDAGVPFASGGDMDFSRVFEPVSRLAEEASGADGLSFSGGFGSLSASGDADEGRRREVEFELAQERLDSTMAALVESQRAFFYTNQTRDVGFRILQLKKLYRAIQDNEGLLAEALRKDLSKSSFEAYATEIGLVLHEIHSVVRQLKAWARPKRKRADLHLFPAHFKIYTEPFGVSLVLSTWNYPVLLSLGPIVSSIAAGNTVVLKTSEYAEATNAALKTLLEKTFNRSYLAVVQGGYTENHALLEQRFDFIFFTGSQNVGRIVMSSAARFLTPVCLELGGKSPCIVDASANLEVAARRIVWGKFLNAGQTCVAPDYVLVDKGVKDTLIRLMQGEILRQYGGKPLENKDYPKIISERRFVHLSTLCPKAEMDFVENKISPTIMDLGDMNGREASEAAVMQEEIFGPLLPVLSFDTINAALSFVSARPTPLSLYMFSTNAINIRRATQELRFGGGCVNDVVFHLASSKAPFGGEGESGMGNYHGVYGFETFSHKKTVLVQSPKMDLRIRYAPYTDKALRLLHRILK